MKAFVLGAGLGTRLRPLTEWLPKPLVPVYHRPLITYAFDHLQASFPALEGLVVNTHHCPEAYEKAFPNGSYRDLPIAFRHEPVLLETAGGIANVADLLGDAPFVVYNGDILTDLPLGPLLECHRRSGLEVTLLLRRQGPSLRIAYDPATQRVVDLRGVLGVDAEWRCQFTGIYVVEPEFLKRLTPGVKESVVPIFLQMIREGEEVGGVVADEGHWWDLGDIETYIEVHRRLPATDFPRYADGETAWERIASEAKVHPLAQLGENVVIGPGASVGEGARLENTIVWPDASVAEGATLRAEVARGGRSDG